MCDYIVRLFGPHGNRAFDARTLIVCETSSAQLKKPLTLHPSSVPNLVFMKVLLDEQEAQTGKDTSGVGEAENIAILDSSEGVQNTVEKHSSDKVQHVKLAHPLAYVQTIEEVHSLHYEQGVGSLDTSSIGQTKDGTQPTQERWELKEPKLVVVGHEAEASSSIGEGQHNSTAPSITAEPSSANRYDRDLNESIPEVEITFDIQPLLADPPPSNDNSSARVLKGLQTFVVAPLLGEGQHDVTELDIIPETMSTDQPELMIEAGKGAEVDLCSLPLLQMPPFPNDKDHQEVLSVVQKMSLAPAIGREEHSTIEYDSRTESCNADEQDSTSNTNLQEAEVNLYSLPPLPSSPRLSNTSRSSNSSTLSDGSSSYGLDSPDRTVRLYESPGSTPESSPKSSPKTAFFEFQDENEEPVKEVKQTHDSPILASESPAKRPKYVVEGQPKTYCKIPRPVFPIRMSDDGPKEFSLQAQMHWVKWRYRLGCLPECEWRVEPPIRGLKKLLWPALRKLSGRAQSLKIEFLSVGGYNSAYTVTVTDVQTSQERQYVLRVALPVYPYYKVESDVATTVFVQHFTKIPVPQIYIYDSSANNELGLEWILMEKALGQPMMHRWLDLDNSIHEKITLQVADWQDELSRITATEIGALYLRYAATDLEFYIGRLCNIGPDRHILYDTYRGPFDSINDLYDSILHGHIQRYEDDVNLLTTALTTADVHDKLRPRLEALLPKREEILASQLHKDDRENRMEFGPVCIPARLSAWRALRCNLRKINADPDDTMCTRLGHSDISESNVMIDADNNITALLDWEHIDFVPIILHDKYPVFLEGDDVSDVPVESVRIRDIKGEPDPLIWAEIASEQFEIIATKLRSVYTSRLEQLQSPLLDRLNEEDDSFDNTLNEWVITTNPTSRDLREWIEYQLESDDEEGKDDGADGELNDSEGMVDGMAEHISSMGAEIQEE